MIPRVEHIFYPYCYRCPFNLEYPGCGYRCVSYIDDYLFHKFVPPEEVAMILVEPIQGEGGMLSRLTDPSRLSEISATSMGY